MDKQRNLVNTQKGHVSNKLRMKSDETKSNNVLKKNDSIEILESGGTMNSTSNKIGTDVSLLHSSKFYQLFDSFLLLIIESISLIKNQ